MTHHRLRQAARIRDGLLLSLALSFVAGAVAAAPRRSPTIFQVYATAETTTSVDVVWNTNVASDSLVQYSIQQPVPSGAPVVYVAAPVTTHVIALEGLAPGTLYYYKVTSCAKQGCATASGTFETFPSCPDEVPAISGDWQRDASPNVAGSTALSNQLLGVAAFSEADAWAVGWAQQPSGPPYVKRTLTEHYDGAAWRIVPSPNPGGDVQSVLHSVSGASAADVWAVGSTHNGTLPSRTLIEHWNGVSWQLVPSPSPDTQLNELRGVAAVAPDDVWAVGHRGGTHGETPLETLVLHWDGAAWTQVASPNVPGGANQLFAVTALAADDVWAVGFAGGTPLALHWNGGTWTVVPVPRDAGLGSEWLTGIAGASGDDVWAVGQGKGVFSNQTFATLRHWDGSRWTAKVCRAASASNPPDGYEGGGPDAYFTGISAATVNDVWAVGVRGSGPLILHWDGGAWTSVTHPRAFPNAASLRAVATIPEGSAWSVGFEIEVQPSGSASPERTLVDRYRP